MNVIPHTSDRILRESARLFAVRGFYGTSIEDIGTACGTSGPAIYKHFSSKLAILAALLLDISRQLVEGGRHVVEEAGPADRALMALIAFHASFAANESDLIRIQDRDLGSLDATDRRTVRRLQREYVELWVSVLMKVQPRLSVDAARIRAHAAFGLLNSTAHIKGGPSVKVELIRMAERALRVGAPRSD